MSPPSSGAWNAHEGCKTDVSGMEDLPVLSSLHRGETFPAVSNFPAQMPIEITAFAIPAQIILNSPTLLKFHSQRK